MEHPFDPERVPPPFGLANTGAICHFNALLQGLAACPGFTDTVAANRAYMAQTQTGRALYNYARAVQAASPAAAAPGFEVDCSHSSRILQAMVADLQVRRPKTRFGFGMEGASEGLTLLMDMIEPASAPSRRDATGAAEPGVWHDAEASAGQGANPVANLFMMRVIDRVWCERCHAAGRRGPEVPGDQRPGVVSYRVDVQYSYNFFQHSAVVAAPHTFAQNLLAHHSEVEDYKCEVCARAGEASGAGAPEGPGRIFRSYRMARVPPVLPVVFNQYARPSQHYFPSSFQLKSSSNTLLVYRVVAQLEHSGSAQGGHYWARALRSPQTRARGEPNVPHVLNDMSCSSIGSLGPNPAVYIVLYHYSHEAQCM